MPKQTAIVKIGTIQQRILLIRGEKVVVDADLAGFYGVTTKALNQAVRRNRNRFPDDFVFQLTTPEKLEVIAICDHLRELKYSRSNSYVFTDLGRSSDVRRRVCARRGGRVQDRRAGRRRTPADASRPQDERGLNSEGDCSLAVWYNSRRRPWGGDLRQTPGPRVHSSI